MKHPCPRALICAIAFSIVWYWTVHKSCGMLSILLDEKDGVSAYMSHGASLEPLSEEKCASLERVVTRRGLQCVVVLVLF